MDDIDQLLTEEDQNLPTGSQPENKNNGSDPENQNDGAGGQSPEEVEFSKLGGKAQDRFRTVYNRWKQAEEEKTKLQSAFVNPPPPPPQGAINPSDPSVKQAVDQLSGVGMATKDYVQQLISESLGRKTFTDELASLEKSLDGTDGKPKFTREEYEEYISRNPQYKEYLPVDVYNTMYKDELLDWEVSKRGGKPQARSLKPSRTATQSQGLTPEFIEKRLKEPDADKWLTEHYDEVNKVVATLR